MKKVLLSLSIALGAIVFNSCEKSKSITDPEARESLQFINGPDHTVITVYKFTWDEWGRAARNCKGGGLCNFRLEEVEIRIPYPKFTSAVVKIDNKFFVDINANDQLVFEDDTKKLYVDEDINVTAHDDQQFKLPAGEYAFDSQIGDSGGYRVELIKL